MNTLAATALALLVFGFGCITGFGIWTLLHTKYPYWEDYFAWVLTLGTGLLAWAFYYMVLFSISIGRVFKK
jgi:hypothetical protein